MISKFRFVSCLIPVKFQDFQRDLEKLLDYAGILIGNDPGWLYVPGLTLTTE